MNKFGFLIALSAIVFASCSNKSTKQEDGTLQDSTSVENAIIDSHNSQTSLDWAGVYEGTMPCADCEGIRTVIELKEDNTFNARFTYLGKSTNENEFSEKGTFTWDTTGSNVILKSETDTAQYKVGENRLTLLDAEGKVIMGELADFYVLKKQLSK